MLLDIAATGAMGGTGHLHGLRPRGGQRRGAWPGVRVACVNAAHILGSASILVELTEGETRRRVLFSGDIGNSGRPLLMNPVVPEDIDVAAMESTYADRNHRPIIGHGRGILRGGGRRLPPQRECCHPDVSARKGPGNVREGVDTK